MKRKMIVPKVLTATAVLSSAFVAINPASAAVANEKVADLVKKAERDALNLKSAITLSSQTKKTNELPWAIYNQTKDSYKKAKEAVSKLTGNEKSVYETRLQQNVEIYIGTENGHVGRATAYIDAVSFGKKTEAIAKELEQKLNNNIVDDETEKLYHELSKSLKKQTVLFNRVYGFVTQEKLKELFTKPALTVKDNGLYPVSIKTQLDRVVLALKEKRYSDADKYMSLANTQMQDAIKLGKMTKDSLLQKNVQSELDQVLKTYNATRPSTSTPSAPPPPVDTQTVYNAPGTYGPQTGVRDVNGPITISSDDVTLKNMVIHGDLIITESVADGEVHLQNVTVTGNTYVKGGGMNSVYFENSVLATVIVNKNDGKVRIVASGSTRVVEVQLESYGKLEEAGDLTNEGFTNVTLNESVQSTDTALNVELVGAFETINSRATQVRIHLSEETDINTIILSAIATVLGTGSINSAQINIPGSTLESMPQNIVLNNGSTVTVGGTEITENQSNEHQTSLKSIRLDQSSVSVDFNSFVAGLSLADFDVSATLNDEPVTLNDLSYEASLQRFTFVPVAVEGNVGKTLKVRVTPKDGSTKLTGQGFEGTTEIGTGFSGRLTDIAGVGVENAVIKFSEIGNEAEGNIVGTAVTDKNGFYSVKLPAGQYKGEVSGPGLVTSYIIASAPTGVFNINQNETAIRAAASNEIKIMLSWGENPSDLDSHLIGKTIDGSSLHTWYSEKVFKKDGVTYVDLDWDDTESYGPETTTIRKLVDGKYVFYTHNYSGESPLDESNAVVKVFKGNASTPEYEYTVPDGNGKEEVWVGFEINISGNGANVQVTPINQLEDNEDSAMYYLNPIVGIQNLIADGESLLSETSDQTNETNVPARTHLQEVIDAAKVVIVNTNATPAELLATFVGLKEAMTNLTDKLIEYTYSDVDLAMNKSETQNLDDFFVGELGLEADGIRYEVTAPSTGVISYDLEGNQLTVTATQIGTAEMTIKATDKNGMVRNAIIRFNVVSSTEDPGDGTVEAVSLGVDDTYSFDLDSYFAEKLGVNPKDIVYSLDGEGEVVNGEITPNEDGTHTLNVVGVALGEQTLVVRGTDVEGNNVEKVFDFNVFEPEEIQIASTTYLDEDNNRTVSVGDKLQVTYESDISDIEMPSTVGVVIKDSGDQDLVYVYSSTTEFTAENLLYAFSTSDVVDAEVSFDGSANIVENQLSFTLDSIVSGDASHLKQADAEIPLQFIKEVE